MLKKLMIGGLAVALSAMLAWSLSPWPAALFYRTLMDRGGVAMNEALKKHVPPGILVQRDLSYAEGDPDARLDIYRSASAGQKQQPTIVWVHGGAFLAGDKDQISNYLKILAGHGYVTIGVNYTLAPQATYPMPVRQVAAALNFLNQNAERFGIDPNRFALAGDSAGAQIAAQMTAVISSLEYAARLGIDPPLARDQLRGAILFCGFHDPAAISGGGAFGNFVTTAAWSYFGVKDISGDPRAQHFSIVENVTPKFPPLFISAGNADPLEPQSKALAKAATKQGVTVDALFFAEDYEPPLPHEYQFNLDSQAGQTAIERVLEFAASHLR